jgi:hypothetical protein
VLDPGRLPIWFGWLASGFRLRLEEGCAYKMLHRWRAPPKPNPFMDRFVAGSSNLLPLLSLQATRCLWDFVTLWMLMMFEHSFNGWKTPETFRGRSDMVSRVTTRIGDE